MTVLWDHFFTVITNIKINIFTFDILSKRKCGCTCVCRVTFYFAFVPPADVIVHGLHWDWAALQLFCNSL